MSLRVRMMVIIMASVVVAVLATGLVVRQIAVQSQLDALRGKVVDQIDQARTIYHDTGVLTLDAVIEDPHLPAGAHRGAMQGNIVTQRAEVDGTEYLFAAAPIRVGTHNTVVSVRYNTEDSTSVARQIDLTILSAMVVTAIVVGGVSLLITGQMSRRLTRGAMAARRIADGDASVRVSQVITPANDEVQAFAEAVDSAVARLAERIAAEQHFASDLAHELRTPLTGLINAANLLEEDTRAAQLVRERAERIRTLTEDLLEIARAEQGQVQALSMPVNISSLVASHVQNLEAGGAVEPGQVTVRSNDSTAVVQTDGRRLERILGNLIGNGLSHGAPPVAVTVYSDSICVRDHGPGYPQFLLAHGPSRFGSTQSNRGGMGLGLVIASSQARVLGLRLELANITENPAVGETGGALATLWFPR